ncbi:MAG: ABC transporter permease [Dehalococcoidia bacterium]
MTPRLPGPQLSAIDLFAEALAGVTARVARTLLTVAGVVLGVAALVATLGLSQTAGNRIVGRFDALAATGVVAEPQTLGAIGGGRASARLPWDAEARLRPLAGVLAVGAFGDTEANNGTAGTAGGSGSAVSGDVQVRVVAATPGLLEALRGELTSGRFLTDRDSEERERVAVLGAGAASRLGIHSVEYGPVVTVNGDRYVVIGIIDGLQREPDLLDALLLPVGTARDRLGAPGPERVVIETAVGAARQVAGQAALALSPNDPSNVRVTAPPEPRRVKQDVQNDVSALFLVLGLVSLVIGTIGIANVTLVTVLERVGEIGLRRALGAGRRHIAVQFLVESSLIGLAGGVAGSSAGLLVVSGVAWAQRWTPVMEPWVPLGAPLVGLIAGVLAGVYPAIRAASLQPVEALRLGS